MKRKVARTLNLLEIKPLRNVAWELGEEGRAVLIVPKFRNRLLRKWLLPLFAKPDFRIRLDAYGSLIWQHCDGKTAVSEVGEKLRERFGSSIEPLYERLGQFIAKLEREDLVVLSATLSLQETLGQKPQ